VTGELLITVNEAGRRLGLCRRSVQTLIYEGELNSLKIHRSRRVAVVDLEAYVQRLRQDHDNLQPLAVIEGRPR
jgi:excisionase family DNA binding protein